MTSHVKTHNIVFYYRVDFTLSPGTADDNKLEANSGAIFITVHGYC